MNNHVEKRRPAIPAVSAAVRPLIAENTPLWSLTSMRVGGPACWFAKPKTVAELETIYSWALHESIAVTILGGGTNVLFSDAGYAGMVISTRRLKGIRVSDTSVIAAAGERLSELAGKMNRAGLAGLEWACGIPGTVGGAVVMNAGAHDGDMAAVLESVQVLTSAGVREWPVDDLELSYRSSALRTGRLEGIVLEVSLKLQRADPAQCVKREQAVMAKRLKTQPRGASSGCIFKNPATGPSAGELLDRAGCKGMRVGAAVVSDIHANFIINEGQNNAADVLALIDRMRTKVLKHHGIALQPEVHLINTTEQGTDAVLDVNPPLAVDGGRLRHSCRWHEQ